MADFTFKDNRLETHFALHFAAQGRKLAAAGLSTTMVLHCFALLKCLMMLADVGPTPRLVLLAVVVALAVTAHAWTLSIVVRPSEVWRHESVKSSNSLVGATTCMVAGILSHTAELCLKAPVGISCYRGCMLVAESYRLEIALRLHAIQMVCYLFQEVDLYLQSLASGKPRTLWELASDLFIVIVLGKALPILVSAAIESQSRAAFLRSRRLPMTHLSPFWQKCVKYLPQRIRA